MSTLHGHLDFVRLLGVLLALTAATFGPVPGSGPARAHAQQPPAEPGAPPAAGDPAAPAAGEPAAPPAEAATPASGVTITDDYTRGDPGPVRGGVAAPSESAPAESVIEDDVEPSVMVLRRGDVGVAIGGLVQLHLAPYVGDAALLADDDPAAHEGFRLRRARLALEASLPDAIGFLLVVDPLESEPDAGAVSEARVSYAPREWLRLSAGADKVPFSRGELVSSANLATIERPLTVQLLVPQRRLGALIEGTVARRRFSYVAGVMNATEGYALGNQFSGLLFVGRAQIGLPIGPLDISYGVGGYFEDGPATNRMAGSVDLQVSASAARLLVEAICDRTTPDDSPMTSPGVSDKVDRCGGYVEAAYGLTFAERHHVEPVVRAEWLDDNTGLEDAGDAWLLSAGVNLAMNRHLRVQLHYLGRFERESAERANDSVIFSVQGRL